MKVGSQSKHRKLICGIYHIRHTESGRVYVGSSVDVLRRWSMHIGHLQRGSHPNAALQNYFRKYGLDGFDFQVLEECDKTTLLIREAFWIKALHAHGSKKGFNLLKDPEDKRGENAPMFGKRHRPDTIIKMRDAAKKRWESQTAREKHSLIIKRVGKSDERLREASIQMKRRWEDPLFREQVSRRIRERNLLNWKCPEYRTRMIRSNLHR